MDYEKLWKYAKACVDRCTELEINSDTASRKEEVAIWLTMTEEEKTAALNFIGQVNQLRIECKRKFWKD